MRPGGPDSNSKAMEAHIIFRPRDLHALGSLLKGSVPLTPCTPNPEQQTQSPDATLKVLSMNLSACLKVCLYVCLPACLPACLPVCLSIRLSTDLSIFLPLKRSIYLICACVCVSN